MLRCKDIMTAEVVTCIPTESVRKAAQLMKMDDVGSIPIVENMNSRRLVGIVTDRDLTLRILAEGYDSNTTLGNIMSSQIITCGENDSIDNAMKLMADHQIRRLPVVDDNNRIVGIISQGDLATRTEMPKKTAEVVEEISKPNTASASV